MPEIAAPVKIAKIKAYGAEVVVEGATYFDAQALCDAYVAESGALAIHPYATPETIAGQGTVGLEWEEDLGRLGAAPLDTILVAVGGGGLIAGVAAWFDGRVESRRRRAGRIVRVARGAGGRAPGRRLREIGGGRFARLAQRRRTQSRDRSARGRSRRAGERRGDSRRATHASGAIFRSSPSPAARRPTRRWRAAPTARPPGERVGVLVCGANADLAALAAAAV